MSLGSTGSQHINSFPQRWKQTCPIAGNQGRKVLSGKELNPLTNVKKNVINTLI